MSMEQWRNDIDGGKSKYLEKNLSHCHFNKNLKRADLGSNTGLRSEKSAK
jgi:hypothetical protein